jgi:hypothetical protein
MMHRSNRGRVVRIGMQLRAELGDKEQGEREKYAPSLEFSSPQGQNNCLDRYPGILTNIVKCAVYHR